MAADQAVASYGAITLGDALFDLDSIAPLTDSMGADYARYFLTIPPAGPGSVGLTLLISFLCLLLPRASLSLDSALNLTQHQSTSDHLINMRPRMSTSTLQRQIDADDNFGAGLADEVRLRPDPQRAHFRKPRSRPDPSPLSHFLDPSPLSHLLDPSPLSRSLLLLTRFCCL